LDEFDEILSELGWTRIELARRLGLHRNTVSKWKSPPDYVMAYLRLKVEVKRLGE